MSAAVVAGTAHRGLADAVAAALGAAPVACEPERFPDGELRPVVGHVRGADAYVVQPTGPAVNEHVVELRLLLDACRRGGAHRLTAVVPYFGYARQDRRVRAGQPVGARVVAEALEAAGADRLVVVDPHTAALEAMCGMPVEMLTAVPIIAAALAEETPGTAVVVSPDLGAVKKGGRQPLPHSMLLVYETMSASPYCRPTYLTMVGSGRVIPSGNSHRKEPLLAGWAVVVASSNCSPATVTE